jgi:hypothetical protein
MNNNLPLCQCGCGQTVREIGNKFIGRHNTKGVYNPNYGKCHSEETKRKISESKKGNIPWNKGRPHSEKAKLKMSERHKGKKLSEEHKRKIGESCKGKLAGDKNPMFNKYGNKNPNYGNHLSEEAKERISKANIGRGNGRWNEGSSKEPYCFIWDQWLKEQIKERDRYQCQNPDCWGISQKLVIHHIDYHKKNCSVDNLITLCNSCNSRANKDRDFWKFLFSSNIPFIRYS